MVLLLTAQQLGFFSKSEKKWVKRGVRVLRALHTRVRRRSPVSLSVFSLVPDLFFDCSRALENAKIRTILQSSTIEVKCKKNI